jgi:alkyl sulfatase BDS1-like metallo-beta-lactamase superfamily hydrolase
MQEIRIPAECEIGEGYGKVSWGVRAIWENYAGWFHHQSTTELYSVPVDAVYQDIIELAGIDSLVARARELHGKGSAEKALHLLDIVLACDPAHDDALALAIEVHEGLLKRADNFWLNGWIENQLKLLRGGHTDALNY